MHLGGRQLGRGVKQSVGIREQKLLRLRIGTTRNLNGTEPIRGQDGACVSNVALPSSMPAW